MSTPSRLQTHWNKVVPFIKKEWPQFSDTTIEKINGDFDRFLQYLKDIYGNFPHEEAKALDKLNRFFNQLDTID